MQTHIHTLLQLMGGRGGGGGGFVTMLGASDVIHHGGRFGFFTFSTIIFVFFSS